MTDFIVVGNINVITYKQVFPLIKEGKIRVGGTFNKTLDFETPSGLKSMRGISWYSSYKVNRPPLVLTKSYSPDKYPKYDNFDAIEVGKVTDIPKDYDGVMGVPITYLGKHNPNQFEILGCTERWSEFRTKKYTIDQYASANDLNATWVVLNNNTPKTGYKRLLIRKVKEEHILNK